VEVVASLSQGRTAAAQCGLFTHKSVPVIFEPPCMMEVSCATESAPRLNTAEEFYNYKGTENDKQLNDKHTVLSNSIFSVITQQEYYD